jgi:hypothetical protein
LDLLLLFEIFVNIFNVKVAFQVGPFLVRKGLALQVLLLLLNLREDIFEILMDCIDKHGIVGILYGAEEIVLTYLIV